MRKISVFNQITVDGFFATKAGDIQWAHRKADGDADFRDFVAGNASGPGDLLFGRKTYEMMASFWPTPMAAQQMPAVAKGMNAKTKYVASRSLSSVSWQGATLVKGDLIEGVRALKASDGPAIVILGSGSIVAQLSDAGLIDEYQVLILPFVLGEGRTMFEGMKKQLDLTLAKTRTFRNGNAFLVYDLKR
jgi:dihydrofolate reductase